MTAVRRSFAALVIAMGLAGGSVAMAAPAGAQEASGIVAVHKGRWGYEERVFGRASTRQIANSPVWELGATVASITGYGLPLAVTLVTIKHRANEALNSGQCFALVRPSYGLWFFAARTSWDCR